MKKLILFLSVFVIYILAGCNDGNDNTNSSNATPSTTEITNNNTSDNFSYDTEPTTIIPEDTTNPSNNNGSSSEQTSGNVYDDGIDWGPLHQ